MYNEVFKKCPKDNCDGFGYMQIHQIVLGFGRFNLDNPESLSKELNIEQLKELKDAVEHNRWFECETCLETFNINTIEESVDEKINIINSIGK